MMRAIRNWALLVTAIATVAGWCHLVLSMQLPDPAGFALGFALACMATGAVMAMWEDAE